MIIGQIVSGEKLELDLPALVDTRLLIQANSGGGKSWLLRLIAERAGIQTIVLDNEGEFASLREAVDVLLVGASGELPANPRHAALLARRLLEYKVSAVIDLYELKLTERRRFVKLFLESLIHLPRDLWRPTLVVLDEAHIYCPERGSGEAESTEAVISLMSQGRERGYAGVIATQRISKLHKDAAAEANNVIIGRTWLDADQVRAGDALGLSKADRLKLRDVGQGEFYAFGPALGQPGVVHFRSDQVRTTTPFRIPVNFQRKNALILLDQVRTLDKQRLVRRLEHGGMQDASCHARPARSAYLCRIRSFIRHKYGTE
jgi:DNA helicase HerA-like ATPase